MINYIFVKKNNSNSNRSIDYFALDHKNQHEIITKK